MSPSAFAAFLAFILAAPPTVLFTIMIGSDLYMYHGGSSINEAPAPIAGAGLAVLALVGGASLIARKFRRKAA